eukprot:8322444-Alexandrium_andersonii.AAC.1
MATSCREGEVFAWDDSLRHLLGGAREGLRGGGACGDSSDSEGEDPLTRCAEAPATERAAWSTSPPGERGACGARRDARSLTAP